MALPHHLHRQPLRPGPGRFVAPAAREHRTTLRRPHRRPTRAPAVGEVQRQRRPAATGLHGASAHPRPGLPRLAQARPRPRRHHPRPAHRSHRPYRPHRSWQHHLAPTTGMAMGNRLAQQLSHHSRPASANHTSPNPETNSRQAGFEASRPRMPQNKQHPINPLPQKHQWIQTEVPGTRSSSRSSPTLVDSGTWE
jgi:hypothetical protein